MCHVSIIPYASKNFKTLLQSQIALEFFQTSPEFSFQWSSQKYSGTWELGTPKGLWKTVLNSEVVLFLRSISMYWIGLETEVAVLNSQDVPISQVVLKRGFTVLFSIF